MNEKRFKRFRIADGFKIVAIKDNGKIMNSKQVCNKLNELAEENQQYENEIARLQLINNKLKDKDYTNYKKKIQELQERNNRQAKRLDDIYQLIEQKDWRALSDIMDDFKKAEEQLQSEWQTYGDVDD